MMKMVVIRIQYSFVFEGPCADHCKANGNCRLGYDLDTSNLINVCQVTVDVPQCRPTSTMVKGFLSQACCVLYGISGLLREQRANG